MRAPQWSPVELVLRTDHPPAEPYTAVDVDVEFRHDVDGTVLVRPAFWDGDGTWRVRFASPVPAGRWSWRARSVPSLPGIDGAIGSLEAAPPSGDEWLARGLLRMGDDGRTVRRADGSPWLLVADTPWALPFRATVEDAAAYAGARSAQGFTAALLMSMQPDLSRAPVRARGVRDAWDEAFEDLPDGRLQRLRPEYFRTLDAIAATLLQQRIVPVWQPVFHGYGWRGGPVGGQVLPPADYARYCRYLVARYGASPALWLVGADGSGNEPTISAGGDAIEASDAYAQPAGIHYAPNASNHACADARWVDFHWCQTGHSGEHKPERLAGMWLQRPVTGIANGEPTYERIGSATRATDWWQGEEAWRNLCAGGTMGVAYGAGSLWQWRVTRDEDHPAWCSAEGCDWRDALRFPGAAHVGRIAGVLAGIPLAGCAPDSSCTYGRPGLLDPGRLYIGYLFEGGRVDLLDARVPPRWRAVDLLTGDVVGAGDLGDRRPVPLELPTGAPLALICTR